MSKRNDLSRRGFLTALGLGSVAASAPFLRVLRASAQVEAPTRLLIWYTGNGTLESAWRPGGGERDFTLGPILEPLAPFRDQLLLFGPQRAAAHVREEVGLSIRVNHEEGPSGGHGLAKILTGVVEREFDGTRWAGGPSVDQYIASAIGAPTPFRSLELGIRVGGGAAGAGNRLNYRGPGQPLPPQNDPVAAFDTVFGGFSPDTPDPALERARRRRRSILDFASGELTAIQPRMAAEHRRMLDAHLESIRDLERRIDPIAASGAACALPSRPDAPPRNGWDEYDNMPLIGRLQMDTMAMAFACDLTRVGTLQWGWAGANTKHPWLDINEWHHTLSHEPISNDGAMDKLVSVNRWYSEQLAYFLGRLAEMPEGDGTVLDNTVVLWCNELSDGRFHTHQNMPWLLAGSAGGYFRTGRYMQYANKSHNDLLLSLCHAMGVEDETFGDPSFCSGPLSGLT